MSNPKFALVAYFIAIGFILAVAFHPVAKSQLEASAQVAPPIASQGNR
jgi:hypothetical protein